MRHLIKSIHRARPGVLAVAAGALALTSIGVQAQQLQEVTVTVPAARTIGHDANGAPIQQVTASARVQYDPMMLTSRSGRALLQQKVTDVARRLCREVNSLAPPAAADETACVQQALHGVRVQIAAAAIAQKAG
jgi:UrcA family protein